MRGRPKKKVAATTEQPPAAAPTPEQLLYARAYDHGAREGYNAAAQRVLAALGVTLTQGDGVGGEDPAATDEEEEEGGTTPLSPLPPLAEPPAPLCSFCGHGLAEHEPLTAKSCFVKGCKCRGYTTKPILRIGGLKVHR